MDNQGDQEISDQNTDSAQALPQPASGLHNAPYEVPLTKAFDKLTSQIFLFLLAYVILLIGLAVFGSGLAVTLRSLFYIVPILGVAAYVWQHHSAIVKDGKDRGIDVKAGKVLGHAHVGGVVNAPRDRDISNDVKVRVRRAQDSASVIGVEYGNGDESNDETSYIARIFQQLSSQNQRRLIDSAHRMLNQQEKSHG